MVIDYQLSTEAYQVFGASSVTHFKMTRGKI